MGIAWRWSKAPSDLPGVTRAYRALLPRKAMSELQKLAGDSDPAAMRAFLGRRESSVFPAGRPAAAQPQADRKFSGLRTRAAEGAPHTRYAERDEFRGAIERVAQFSDERSRGDPRAVGDGEVKVHSSVSETGESEESIPAVRRPGGRDRVQRAVPAGFPARRRRPTGSLSCSRIRTAPASFARPARKRTTTAT